MTLVASPPPSRSNGDDVEAKSVVPFVPSALMAEAGAPLRRAKRALARLVNWKESRIITSTILEIYKK